MPDRGRRTARVPPATPPADLTCDGTPAPPARTSDRLVVRWYLAEVVIVGSPIVGSVHCDLIDKPAHSFALRPVRRRCSQPSPRAFTLVGRFLGQSLGGRVLVRHGYLPPRGAPASRAACTIVA